MNDTRDAALIAARDALQYIAHQSESQRIWAGMDWRWPFPHKRIWDKAREGIALINAALKKEES